MVKYRNVMGLQRIQSLQLWEIQRFYPAEYQIGLGALDIEEKLGVRFESDEAASIALHIIDAKLNIDINQSMKMTQTMQDILNIIKYYIKHVIASNGKEFDNHNLLYPAR